MPLLLDLFCGAGGAAMGYHRAGFRVIGVDLKPQPHYPFKFHRGDFREALARDLCHVDAIHASPPCQAFTKGAASWRTQAQHPDLIASTRHTLHATGKPYVIENVPQAPLFDSAQLCGTMFGLRVFRHRNFESSLPVSAPAHHPHTGRIGHGYVTVSGHTGGSSSRDGWSGGDVAAWRQAMDISWMTARELAQAIPPAYTEHIGRQVLACLS